MERRRRVSRGFETQDAHIADGIYFPNASLFTTYGILVTSPP